tara:strand:- start:2467 stop:3129 length:663 start_codon:yes stop_codon:yes gene_type:complete
MSELNQLLLNLKHKQNFNEHDFYISKSNFYAYQLIQNWPKWEKNVLNIFGEKKSGKTHLTDIFLSKNKGIKINSKNLNDEIFKGLKLYENIVLDDFNNDIEERLMYALLNFIDHDNKFLIINTLKPINEMSFILEDIKSRAKNCIFAKIEPPDDDLIFALLLKSFSDRQIAIDKKLIDFITKRIDRSYSKISDFIYKVDELSLKKKKPINIKTVKEILKR